MNSLLNFEPLLTPLEAAAILQISVGTLAVWRATKRYPLIYLKIGRAVRYKKSDIEAFIAANRKEVAG
jgi:predicted site-specific integrase-resolvase